MNKNKPTHIFVKQHFIDIATAPGLIRTMRLSMIPAALSLIFITVFLTLPAMAQELRIMSYNVRNCVGMDGKRDYDRVANVITRAQPDVVAVQELDKNTRRNGHKDALQELAKRTDMRGVFAKAIDFQGGEYGVGILSKEQPLRVKRIPLPGREEARVLLVAEFKDYVFCSTHLSLRAEDSMNSIAIITREAKNSKKPFFIAGDFNLEAQHPVMKRMMKDFTPLNRAAQATYPADKPNKCIDFIFIYNSSAFQKPLLKETTVMAEATASDHRPIYAKAAIRKNSLPRGVHATDK